MTLKLPEVSLVLVETRENALARLAVEDCLKVAEFGDVLIVTNRPDLYEDLPCKQEPRFHLVEDWPEKIGWSRSWWFDVPPLLRTSHTLNLQWDSFICDATQWDPDFLNYDYIGAPWWYTDSKNVGNGGFCLVSSALKRYIYDRRDKYPCISDLDDDLLCRTYRPSLEEAGFVWAPEPVAHRFAFECCKPSPDWKSFGFHACFNFPDVLDRPRLVERIKLMCASPYISRNYMMKAMYEKHPALIKEILSEIDQPISSAA